MEAAEQQIMESSFILKPHNN